MPLGEVTHVDEGFDDVRWKLDRVEELRCPGALLVDGHRGRVPAVGVPGRVCASFSDPCEKRLRRECPIDARIRREAVSRDSAHQRVRSDIVS